MGMGRHGEAERNYLPESLSDRYLTSESQEAAMPLPRPWDLTSMAISV